jgi:hypothetical protein
MDQSLMAAYSPRRALPAHGRVFWAVAVTIILVNGFLFGVLGIVLYERIVGW